MQSRYATDPAYPVGASATSPALLSRISWGAIIAGALVAVTVGLSLNTLGLAIGATTVDATGGGTPSAASLGIGGGVWLLVSNLVGLGVGGYVAARLAGIPDSTDAALHGLGVWAVGILLTSVILGGAVAGTASGAFNAVSGVASGAARGAGSAIGAVTDEVDPQAIIERARQTLTGPSEPARMTTEQRGAEMATLIGRRIANGELVDADRQRLNALVAAEAGISPEEAAQRVQAYEAEAQRLAAETEARARRVADTAASGAATAAFWLFAAMVLGGCASVGGAFAGRRSLDGDVAGAPRRA